jgi:hypothetical protein
MIFNKNIPGSISKNPRLTSPFDFAIIRFNMTKKFRLLSLFLIQICFLSSSCANESGMYEGSQNTAIVILTLLYLASFYSIITFRFGKGGLFEASLSVVILLFLLICLFLTKYYFVGICFFIVGLANFLSGKNKFCSFRKKNSNE